MLWMHNLYLKGRILFLYIYLVVSPWQLRTFTKPNLWHKKYEEEKELILSMFCRLTGKSFGLTHIWGGKKRSEKHMDKSNLLLCVKILASQIYAISKATSGKNLLTENNLMSQQKSPQNQSHLTPLVCVWCPWSLARRSELFKIT